MQLVLFKKVLNDYAISHRITQFRKTLNNTVNNKVFHGLQTPVHDRFQDILEQAAIAAFM